MALFVILSMVLSSLLAILGPSEELLTEQRDSCEASINAGPDYVNVVFHMHYDGVQEIADDVDYMDTNGPLNPVVFDFDYDADGKWGVTLKKNNSPTPPYRHHYFVLEPALNSPVYITGDGNFSFWGGSKDNTTRMDLVAALYDSTDDIVGGDVLLASGSMFEDPFLRDWDMYSIILPDINYTLAANHTLILEIRRGDTNNDEFYLQFDQLVLDSTLNLTISTQFDVTEFGAVDANGTVRNEFGNNEQITVFANITDSLGVYDIQTAHLEIINLSDMQVIVSSDMPVLTSDTGVLPSWAVYSESIGSLASGNYRSNITVFDLSGNSVWIEWTFVIISVDHFVVGAPSNVTAGDSFNITIEAVNATSVRLYNWSGVVDIQAVDSTTFENISGLSVQQVNISLEDHGYISVSESINTAPLSIRIRVSMGTVFGISDPISILPGPIVSLVLDPNDISMLAGEMRMITANGTDSYGNTNSSWSPYWNLTNPIVDMVIDGVSVDLTGTVTGSAVLYCQDNESWLIAQVNITVSASLLSQIVITTPGDTVWEGRSMEIQAEGFDSYGNPVDISSAVWSSEGFVMSQIIGSGSTGIIYAGMIPETGSVCISLGGMMVYTTIEVITPPFGPYWSPPISDQYMQEDGSLEAPLDLSQFWYDVNGTFDLSWYVTGVNNSLLTISADHQDRNLVHITPQPNQFGADYVSFWVRDPQGYTDFQDVQITVTPVNDHPEFVNDPPNEIYVKFDLPYTFDYDYYVHDADDVNEDLIITVNPSNRASVDGLQVSFLFPDLYDQEPYYEILTVTLSDGSQSDSLTIKVWATTDTPPDLIMPLPDVTIYEGEIDVEAFDLDDYFSDVDGDMLYYTKGFKYIEINIAPLSNLVLVSSPSEWSGQTNAVFVAHDPTGAIRTDTILVTVIPVNDPPSISPMPTINVRYDEVYELDLRPYVYDPDNGFDDFTIALNDPIHVSYESLYYPHLSLLFPANLLGGGYDGPYEVEVQLRVTDTGGLFDSEYFTVRVSDNYPPRANVNPPSLQLLFPEDGTLTRPDSINLYSLFTDPDGDDLTFTFEGNENITIIVGEDGWVNFSAVPNWYGTETVKFTATDPQIAWASLTVRIDVSSVNDPPVVESIPDVRHYGGRQWSMSIAQYVSDIDHEQSQLRVVIVEPGYVQAVGLVLYFDLPENVSSTMVLLYLVDEDGASSELIEFRVEIKKTMSEMIGYPWSLPVILLLAGILGYILARKIPMPHEFLDLFIIHNDGRLIDHIGKYEDDGNGLDRDVVSAMLTAVQEFIRDSFRETSGGLKMLEFGDKKVVIEKSRWIYGALIYTGWPPKPFFKTFARFVDDIENRYGPKIERWDGTLRSLDGIKDMSRLMINNVYVPGHYEHAPGMPPMKKVPVISDEEVVDMIDSDN